MTWEGMRYIGGTPDKLLILAYLHSSYNEHPPPNYKETDPVQSPEADS